MDRAAYIASFALEALLVEAAATPKPGLIDRANCGAHADMDFFTFQISAAAIAPFLPVFVRTGIEHMTDAPALLTSLRRVGLEAERAMFARTSGVNTRRSVCLISFRRSVRGSAAATSMVWMLALPRQKETRRISPAVRRARAGQQRQGSLLCAVSPCRSIAH